MSKFIISILLAIIFAGLIILSIEKEFSFFHIFLGFILFIFPCMFLSSFTSKILAFALTVSFLLFAYLTYHFKIQDAWVGFLLALNIGLPIYFFRIKNAKVEKGH